MAARRGVAVGVDLGLIKTVLVKSDADLILTETGGISRPSLVSFVNRSRLVGEEAAAQATSSSTVGLNWLLVGESDLSSLEANPLLRYLPRGMLHCSGGSGTVSALVNYNDEQKSVPVTALLGMFLSRQDSRIREVVGSDSVKLAFVLPPHSGQSVARAVTEACAIAGIDASRLCLVDKIDAMVSAFRRKEAGSAAATAAQANKTVLMVDVGASSATVLRLRVSGGGGGVGGGGSIVAKAHATVPVGGAHFDALLFDHFSRAFYATSVVAPDSKRGVRLLTGCERLKKLLSQLPEASVVVENMTDDGADWTLRLKRSELVDLAASALSMLRDAALAVLTFGDSDSAEERGGQGGRLASAQVVELLGGGSRLPAVQALFSDVCPSATLGARFDESSIAVGAALVAVAGGGSGAWSADNEAALVGEAPSKGLLPEQVQALAAQEKAWQQNDAALLELLHTRNAIEATLLHFRSVGGLHPTLARLLPAGLEAFLDEQEEWLWGNPDAVLGEVQAKRAALEQSLYEQCRAFLSAVDEQRLAKEDASRMDVDAVGGGGRGGGGGGGEGGGGGGNEGNGAGGQLALDAKIADRMRLTQKNLSEAHDLLASAHSEIQFRAAIARFNKAYSHCLSIPSSSPSEAAVGGKRSLPGSSGGGSSSAPNAASNAAQVAAWKEAIQLGLATCYQKNGNVDLAISACNLALQALPESVAALSTRSHLFVAKKDWERAAEDAQLVVRVLGGGGGGGGGGRGSGGGAVKEDELAAAKLWASKLRQRAKEEKEKKGGCVSM